MGSFAINFREAAKLGKIDVLSLVSSDASRWLQWGIFYHFPPTGVDENDFISHIIAAARKRYADLPCVSHSTKERRARANRAGSALLRDLDHHYVT